MVLDVSCADAALCQRSRVCGERGAVPRGEAHGGLSHCTSAGARKYLPGVHEAVPLGAQSEYAALNEEQLDESEDTEYDVNEDSSGRIAECLLLRVARVGAGAHARQTRDGKVPTDDGTGDQEDLDRECQQGGETETAIRRNVLGFQKSRGSVSFWTESR